MGILAIEPFGASATLWGSVVARVSSEGGHGSEGVPESGFDWFFLFERAAGENFDFSGS